MLSDFGQSRVVMTNSISRNLLNTLFVNAQVWCRYLHLKWRKCALKLTNFTFFKNFLCIFSSRDANILTKPEHWEMVPFANYILIELVINWPYFTQNLSAYAGKPPLYVKPRDEATGS